MKRSLFAIAGLFLVCLLFTGCLSSDKKEPVVVKPAEKKYQPGIVLTFDDDYIDDWYNADQRLHFLDWKATFFICKYGSFTEGQKKKLHYLQDRGHDIGGHGYNHQNAVKYSAAHGLDGYIKDEILPLKAAMAKDGFAIRSFAYPDGARDKDLDKELFDYFDIIRGTTYGELPPAEQYCYYTGNRLIYGLGIDDDYKQFNVPYYKSLMEYAKKNNKIVIFYGHKTVDNADENLETPMSALEDICKYAKDNGLRFYTVDELRKM